VVEWSLVGEVGEVGDGIHQSWVGAGAGAGAGVGKMMEEDLGVESPALQNISRLTRVIFLPKRIS
jgi:hypothetical protein